MKSSFNFTFSVFAGLLIIGIHGLDYSDLEATNATCPEFDSCAVRRYAVKNCECDEKCVIYNDCCIDSKYLEEKSLNSSKFTCMPDEKDSTFGVYVINTCQQNWQGPNETKNKCEVFDDMSDPLMSTRATDERRGVTYRSRYCAECNNAIPDELTYWDISTHCHTPSERYVSHTFDDLKYSADLNEWGFTRDNVYYTCDILFELSFSLSSDVRDCRGNLIGTCPSTWNRKEIKRLCETYMAMVVYEGHVYRNPHCAFCNGVSFEKLECTGILVPREWLTFDIMFDVNASDGDIVGMTVPKKSSCPEGQNYDPFFKKCRELSCGMPGLKMVDGNCVKT